MAFGLVIVDLKGVIMGICKNIFNVQAFIDENLMRINKQNDIQSTLKNVAIYANHFCFLFYKLFITIYKRVHNFIHIWIRYSRIFTSNGFDILYSQCVVFAILLQVWHKKKW